MKYLVIVMLMSTSVFAQSADHMFKELRTLVLSNEFARADTQKMDAQQFGKYLDGLEAAENKPTLTGVIISTLNKIEKLVRRTAMGVEKNAADIRDLKSRSYQSNNEAPRREYPSDFQRWRTQHQTNSGNPALGDGR